MQGKTAFLLSFFHFVLRNVQHEYCITYEEIGVKNIPTRCEHKRAIKCIGKKKQNEKQESSECHTVGVCVYEHMKKRVVYGCAHILHNINYVIKLPSAQFVTDSQHEHLSFDLTKTQKKIANVFLFVHHSGFFAFSCQFHFLFDFSKFKKIFFDVRLKFKSFQIKFIKINKTVFDLNMFNRDFHQSRNDIFCI